MTTLFRPSVLLLATALALGIAADVFLRAVPPGIGWTLWLLLLPGSFLFLARALDRQHAEDWQWVALAAAACALSISWRDSAALTLLNVAGAIGGCVLIATRLAGRSLRTTSIYELAHGMLVHMVHAIAGAGFLLAREFIPARRSGSAAAHALPSVLLGGLIALPVMLLFGSLFASADASFEQIAGQILDFDLTTFVSHTAFICIVAWIAAGFLRGSLVAEEVPAPASLRESLPSPGIIELGVVLGLLDALFLLFVALQIPYLFGGSATVAVTPALTYASYFRRGFFELTAVACLAILVLLLADWAVRKETRRDVVIFRSLAGLNLALLGVITASAWHRFLLYQEAYGLTEARVYAAAVLTGTGLVVLWFACSVLAGRRTRFAFGSIIAVYAVVLALDFVNPDALIARINILRGSEGKPLDAQYIATLSADATPELIAGLPHIPPGDAAVISRKLVHFSAGEGEETFRTWNWSRSSAFTQVKRSRVILDKFVSANISTH